MADVKSVAQAFQQVQEKFPAESVFKDLITLSRFTYDKDHVAKPLSKNNLLLGVKEFFDSSNSMEVRMFLSEALKRKTMVGTMGPFYKGLNETPGLSEEEQKLVVSPVYSKTIPFLAQFDIILDYDRIYTMVQKGAALPKGSPERAAAFQELNDLYSATAWTADYLFIGTKCDGFFGTNADIKALAFSKLDDFLKTPVSKFPPRSFEDSNEAHDALLTRYSTKSRASADAWYNSNPAYTHLKPNSADYVGTVNDKNFDVYKDDAIFPAIAPIIKEEVANIAKVAKVSSSSSNPQRV